MTDPADELPEAYYLPVDDDRYQATDATTSPWDEDSQHGGPPTALLAACIDDVIARPDMRLARISVDFLGPVPKGALGVEAEVLRPGRRTLLSEARLIVDGRVRVVARTWHLVTATPPGAAFEAGAGEATLEPLPAPQPQAYFGDNTQWGYGRATEWRTVSGGFSGATGAADVWTRVRIPLVAGRALDGLARLLIVADSANGLSAPLDLRDWLFIPPGVTMHLHRYPIGEWVRLVAASDPGRDGIGLTEGTLSDRHGRCGTVTQPLLVAPR